MKPDDLKIYGDSDNCPIRNVLDRIGDKWSMLVLLVLNDTGTMRFNELDKCIETISQKMLSATLKTLEADGLVTRKVFPEIPPRVEYKLSERGESLIPHLKSLTAWAKEHFDAIQQSRMEFSR
jgi:DNA-binding HxlR family transcriptional regulator